MDRDEIVRKAEKLAHRLTELTRGDITVGDALAMGVSLVTSVLASMDDQKSKKGLLKDVLASIEKGANTPIEEMIRAAEKIRGDYSGEFHYTPNREEKSAKIISVTCTLCPKTMKIPEDKINSVNICDDCRGTSIN